MRTLSLFALAAVLVTLPACDALSDDSPTIGGTYTGTVDDDSGTVITMSVPANTVSDPDASVLLTFRSSDGELPPVTNAVYDDPSLAVTLGGEFTIPCTVSGGGDTIACQLPAVSVTLTRE